MQSVPSLAIAMSRRGTVARLTTPDLLILSTLIGVIVTLIFYQFGKGNHISELPVVMRAIDSTYLLNDFYTNASVAFGPRFYFAKLIASMASVSSLPTVYFLLTILCNVLLAIVTSLAARDLHNGCNLTAIIATCCVLSVATPPLGYASVLYTGQLLASRIVFPFLLLALWMGLRKRLLICAILAGASSLIHPTFGLEVGALAIGAAFISDPRTQKAPCSPEARGALFLGVVGGLVILGMFGALSYIPFRSIEQISATDFIHIETYFRHPHHNLPSTWPRSEYIEGACFLFAVGVAWNWWKDKYGISSLSRAIGCLAGLLLIGCVGGYLFVEVVPQRVWAIARPFRLLILAKWIGLIVIAGRLTHRLRCAASVDERVSAYCLAFSILSPVTVGFAHLSQLIWDGKRNYGNRIRRCFHPWVTLIVVVIYIVAIDPPARREIVPAALFAGIVVLSLRAPKRWVWRAGAIVCVIVGPCIFLFLPRDLPMSAAALVTGVRPNLTLDELRGEASEVARWARMNTPARSVFLTPPMLGIFRLLAERAIVVDFKAFPFQGPAMLEWHRRLLACYGKPRSLGWEALRELEEGYRGVDTSRLIALRERYGVSYAILFRNSEATGVVLFQNRLYKVVALDGLRINGRKD